MGRLVLASVWWLMKIRQLIIINNLISNVTVAPVWTKPNVDYKSTRGWPNASNINTKKVACTLHAWEFDRIIMATISIQLNVCVSIHDNLINESDKYTMDQISCKICLWMIETTEKWVTNILKLPVREDRYYHWSLPQRRNFIPKSFLREQNKRIFLMPTPCNTNFVACYSTSPCMPRVV
jgi:hypothetical protein